MEHKLSSSILIFGIAVILVLSFNAFDLQSKFSAFAQTSFDPYPGPIPEGNSTDPTIGPIPEDNSTDPAMIPDPIGNTTDMQNLNPASSDTMQENNMTGLSENMSGPVENDSNPSGSVNVSPSPSGNANVTSSPPIPTNTVSTLPPLEQVKSGVQPKDVQCKQGFTLIIKAEDGSAACVYPQVAQILAQRGW